MARLCAGQRAWHSDHPPPQTKGSPPYLPVLDLYGFSVMIESLARKRAEKQKTRLCDS